MLKNWAWDANSLNCPSSTNTFFLRSKARRQPLEAQSWNASNRFRDKLRGVNPVAGGGELCSSGGGWMMARGCADAVSARGCARLCGCDPFEALVLREGLRRCDPGEGLNLVHSSAESGLQVAYS